MPVVCLLSVVDIRATYPSGEGARSHDAVRATPAISTCTRPADS
jgi:hypothetical protein